MDAASETPRATLVLLPGLDGTDVFFRPLLAQLPSWIRPVVFCYPQTEATGYAGLLDRLRDATSDVPEMYVLGWSFAGPLAVMFAAAEPQRVRGLIFCASFLRSPYPRLHQLTFAAVVPVIWAMRAMRRLPVWLERRDHPLRIAKAETWSRARTRAIAARVRAIADVDTRGLLRTCAQPILCVQFADDRVVHGKHAEEIRSHAASAATVTLPGDHLGMFTGPATLAELVAQFTLVDAPRRARAPG